MTNRSRLEPFLSVSSRRYEFDKACSGRIFSACQLEAVPTLNAYGSEGQGFESLQVHQERSACSTQEPRAVLRSRFLLFGPNFGV